MRNSTKTVIFVVVAIVVVGLIIWLGQRDSKPSNDIQNPLEAVTGTSTVPLPASDTTKVSNSLAKYTNAELGFSVDYPNTWQKPADVGAGVQFVIPIDQTIVSTVNRLQADITVSPGKCAFPPVTKVDERATMNINGGGAGTSTVANMIRLSNSVQGRSYYNRMYSVEKDNICYFFNLTYVALSPESKGLTGSNLTQAQNNNKAIQDTADKAFVAMVKTLTFVQPPAGKDETKVNPTKTN